MGTQQKTSLANLTTDSDVVEDVSCDGVGQRVYMSLAFLFTFWLVSITVEIIANVALYNEFYLGFPGVNCSETSIVLYLGCASTMESILANLILGTFVHALYGLWLHMFAAFKVYGQGRMQRQMQLDVLLWIGYISLFYHLIVDIVKDSIVLLMLELNTNANANLQVLLILDIVTSLAALVSIFCVRWREYSSKDYEVLVIRRLDVLAALHKETDNRIRLGKATQYSMIMHFLESTESKLCCGETCMGRYINCLSGRSSASESQDRQLPSDTLSSPGPQNMHRGQLRGTAAMNEDYKESVHNPEYKAENGVETGEARQNHEEEETVLAVGERQINLVVEPYEKLAEQQIERLFDPTRQLCILLKDLLLAPVIVWRIMISLGVVLVNASAEVLASTWDCCLIWCCPILLIFETLHEIVECINLNRRSYAITLEEWEYCGCCMLCSLCCK